jgi:hypothetical protein
MTRTRELDVPLKMAEKLAHPTGFEPVASAFGGLAEPRKLPIFRAFPCFVRANETGNDVRSTDITRTIRPAAGRPLF